jgi:glyoxylase-like metal-dependent hydrolase (beta-lactamase superfamily II)
VLTRCLLRSILSVLASSPLWTATPAHANPFEYEWQQLAPSVWAAIRHDPFELPQEGNAVIVLTADGVVAFDAGGSPAMGDAIVAKVRQLTDTPVTHVVISHWHGDHMRGLQSIVDAFPRVQILAHPQARDRIVATQDRWLARRVSMAPSIRKAVARALASDQDLSGRPLVDEERHWLEAGLAHVDQLDRENRRTTYVVPAATFEDRLTLHLGGKEIQFLHLGRAHTAGDVIMWLPQDRIVATGDVVTSPIPLMPSPYTRDYEGVLTRIKALGFTTLVPGHGLVARDTAYLDLLADMIRTVSTQMKAAVAQGLAKDAALARIDLSGIERRFTNGDPFLARRFQDYVAAAGLLEAAYAGESGTDPEEIFE